MLREQHYQQGERIVVTSGKERDKTGEVISDFGYPYGEVHVALDGRIYSSLIRGEHLEKDVRPWVQQA